MYALGYTPRDVIRDFGYKPATAYRLNKIYRIAREQARTIIRAKYSISSRERDRTNNLDQKRKKKRVSKDEKDAKAWFKGENGRYHPL